MPATVDFTKSGWVLTGGVGVEIAPTKITVTLTDEAITTHFAKDYGVDFWGDGENVTLKFEVTLTKAPNVNELGVFCALDNSPGTYDATFAADVGTTCIWTDFGASATNYNMLCDSREGSGPMPSAGTPFVLNTKYYCTHTYSATNGRAELNVYSDADRTTLVYSMGRTPTTITGPFQYLTMFATRGSNGAGTSSVTIENLDDGVSDDFAGGGGISSAVGKAKHLEL